MIHFQDEMCFVVGVNELLRDTVAFSVELSQITQCWARNALMYERPLCCSVNVLCPLLFVTRQYVLREENTVLE